MRVLEGAERRRSRRQMQVSGAVAGLIAGLGLAAVLGSEPAGVRPLVLAAGSVMLGVIAAIGLVIVGFISGSRLAWMLPVAAAGVAVGAALTAEDLHWRWSREEFGSLASTDELDCAHGCKVGWWRAQRITRSDALVEVWIENDECYNGRALVRALDASTPATAIPDELSVQSDYVWVSEWHDDWYEVCVRS